MEYNMLGSIYKLQDCLASIIGSGLKACLKVLLDDTDSLVNISHFYCDKIPCTSKIVHIRGVS